MATHTMAQGADTVPAHAVTFERVAGLCGIAAGVTTFLYAVSFVVLKNNGLSALLLTVGGLLSMAVLTAIYGRLRAIDEGAALLGLLFGIAGALGAAIHGGYDLANAIHPPSSLGSLPHATDPRGLLTFGAAGIGLFVVAWLLSRTAAFPAGLSTLGYVLAILLVVIYLARLIVFDSTSPVIIVPVLLAGFIANPAWNVWLGLTLWRAPTR